MLLADVRRDYVLTHFQRLAELGLAELEALYRQLEQEGIAELERIGVASDRIAIERAADMRYVGQEHAVAVPVPGALSDEAARDAIKTAFNEAHQQRFSHSAPEEPTELVTLRVSVFAQIGKPALPRIAVGNAEPPADARRPSRPVVIDDGDAPVACAVFDRARLLAGNVIAGPAIVEEAASSTLIGPHDRAGVDEYGHLVIELQTPSL
jgi:N-methylhydantoinase A